MLLIISSTTIVSASSNVVSKNTIINTVLNNRHKLYDFDKQNDYMFADFDFDGNLELIVDKKKFSTSYDCSIYKIRNKNGKWYLSKMYSFYGGYLSHKEHKFYCYYDTVRDRYIYSYYSSNSPGSPCVLYGEEIIENNNGKLNSFRKFYYESVLFNGLHYYYH